jgi:hypothetical protein
MDTLLLVPLRLDALLVEKDQKWTEAMADFTLLPYFNGQRDVNYNTANISEAILSQPFQNQNFDLKAGIHLHWALPDALSLGESTRDPDTGEIKTDFATVPNRWLITRSRKAADDSKTIEEEWIVESDYLYPDGEGFQLGSISYPVAPDPANKKYHPFRFMGRNMPLQNWHASDQNAEYLAQLTAVGYGEPAFAAFYPNCYSVFGFHDADVLQSLQNSVPTVGSTAASMSNLTGLTYDVLGWYSNESQDYFRIFAEKTLASLNSQHLAADKLLSAFQAALKEAFGWVFDETEDKGIPSRMLCYARIEFQPQAGISNSSRDDAATVAIGNTGTEALAALLAQQLDQANASVVEYQLAAVQYAERLENLKLDISANLQEAWHEKGFQAVPGGTLWTIRPETVKNLQADAAAAHQRSRITLPTAMAHQLNTVNLQQQAYDQARADLASLRKQLFSDWYKYMLCTYPPKDSRDDYPDPEQVKAFIESMDLAPLQQLVDRTGTLHLQVDAISGAVLGATATASSPAALTSQLAGGIQRLLKQITSFNTLIQQDAGIDSNVQYRLKAIAGPRYWQPREPVVLIQGNPARATERDGQNQDGNVLDTQALIVPTAPTVQDYILKNLPALRQTIDGLGVMAQKSGGGATAFTIWQNQPWNPFLLSWEMEVRPLLNKSNLDGDATKRDGYAPDFIIANYQLPETAVDLVLLPQQEAPSKEIVYQGTTVLTQQASLTLKGQLKSYLTKQMQSSGFLKDTYPGQKIDDDFINRNFTDILDKYKQSEDAKDANSALSSFIKAYLLLQDPQYHILSQSLSGFNEALLMHKQTLQLPVAEPLGFPENRAFTASVAKALGANITSAPVPDSDFNPIRSGEMELVRLQLIDTFGQVRYIIDVQAGIDAQQVVIAHALKPAAEEENNSHIALPPRLVQPAKVNFRWLSADLGEMEMNDHPATTPVCGWLLCNNLDNSLVIYDNSGSCLGLIDELGRWQSAPGRDQPFYPMDITNLHLRKLVNFLLLRDTSFQQALISSIDSALVTIEPASFAQYQARALLMGRPVALVRASISFDLQGLPAIHQAWDTFLTSTGGLQRHTDFFEAVKLPVRIGDFQQFNDGLVGFWIEENDGYRDNTFFSPQSTESPHDLIQTHADGPLNLFKSLLEDPDFLVMLVDPRGVVHATSGLLPTKSIGLPPDQIGEALRRIEITFLSTPILTNMNKLHLPLPQEPGYRWSWLERQGDFWLETSTVGVVKRETFVLAFTNGSAIYDALVDEKLGWLKPLDANSAMIVPKDQRLDQDPTDQPPGAPLDQQISSLLPAIEDIFDRAHITSTSDRAGSYSRQALREGWLKLSQDNEISNINNTM